MSVQTLTTPKKKPAVEQAPEPHRGRAPAEWIAWGAVGLGAAAIPLGLASGAYVQPFPWAVALIMVILAAATRPVGIPLPGKGFASFVVAAVTVAVIALGWAPGAIVAALGVLIGDALFRGMPLKKTIKLAGFLTTAAVAGGIVYQAVGGIFGDGALSATNVWPLVLIFALIPLTANAGFYLQLRISSSVPWVDPALTLRWELAVTAFGMTLAAGVLALLSPHLPPAETAVLSVVWVGFAGLGHWLVRRGVEGECLQLVQRMTRAIGAKTEFSSAFVDIQRLTSSLVPWHNMGIGAYRPDEHEFEILLETQHGVPPGTRFSADSGLTAVALARGVPVTDRILTRGERAAYKGSGSEILVPLRHGERLVGLWSVRHDLPDAYRPDEAKMMGYLAPLLAVSITLDSLVRPILDTSDRTAGQTHTIKSSTRELRQRSQQAAEQARRVSDTVRHVAETLARGAAQTEEARGVAEESASLGDATRRSGQQMLETVRGVRGATADALRQLAAAAEVADRGAAQVSHLHEASEMVERFRETIATLAEQSSLLALNASIEAARAGQEGRGFGVVASEIRALADKTSEEAEGIAQGVQDIRNTLETASELIQKTRGEVLAVAEAGVSWSSELDSVVSAAEDVARMGESIAKVAGSAAAGSAEMARVLASASGEAGDGARATAALESASMEQKRLIDELDGAASELARSADGLSAAAAAIRAERRSKRFGTA